MTDDRKEPTLSPLKPDQEDIAHHRQRISGGSGAPPKGAARPNTSGGDGGGGQRPVIVRSKLAPFALLLALTGLGLAGFAYWQLLEAQKTTEAAVARIAELEERLEMTGDESEQSMAAVQAKLKWADSEIRKLWGVAYDNNRKAIAENKSAIAETNNTIANVRQQATTIEKKVNTALDNLRGEIKAVDNRVTAQQGALDKVEETRLSLQRQAQQLTDTVRELRETQSALQSRVKTNEQAIEAIDSFRRTVNRELLELRSQGSAQ